MFITFEGIEGCGKTTQIERAARFAESKGYEVVQTREPGGTPIADRIRAVLLDPGSGKMEASTELLLMFAARAQHVAEVVRPAARRGAVVLCDRFADSTRAYQGYGRGIERGQIETFNRFATGGLVPDLTFLIDLPVEIGLKRARARNENGDAAEGRIDAETAEFHRRVREGFIEIAESEPNRIRRIDGTGGADEVAGRIAAELDAFFETRQGRHR